MEFENFCKLAAVYSSIVAVFYFIYGLLEIVVGAAAWWMPWLEIPELNSGFAVTAGGEVEVYIPKLAADPFAGLVLMIVSLVFAKAAVSLFEGRVEGWSFTTVGLLLAGALFLLNVFIVLADCADAYYPLLWGGEPNYEWSVFTDDWMFNPMMTLFALTLQLVSVYLRKDEFIKEVGRTGIK